MFEIEIIKAINSALSTPALDKFFVFVTTLGNGGAIWILAAIALLCFKKTRSMGCVLAISLIFCLLISNLTLKPLISRPRPFSIDSSIVPIIPLPSDFSFPSGHTTSSFAAAAAIYCCNKKWGIFATVLAALIAFSRLYLMVHYPSDVIFGVVLGTFLGFAAKKSFDFIRRKC